MYEGPYGLVVGLREKYVRGSIFRVLLLPILPFLGDFQVLLFRPFLRLFPTLFRSFRSFQVLNGSFFFRLTATLFRGVGSRFPIKDWFLERLVRVWFGSSGRFVLVRGARPVPIVRGLFRAFFKRALSVQSLVRLFGGIVSEFFSLFCYVVAGDPNRLFRNVFFLYQGGDSATTRGLYLIFL